jgi:hypothetical protein
VGRHQLVPPEPDHDVALPGSGGEHALQRHAGSQDRAHRFYRQQVLGRLNERTVEFIGRKHLPRLVKVAGPARPWGSDDPPAKGGDYFGASCEPRPWVAD